jgi:hypothetical protein
VRDKLPPKLPYNAAGWVDTVTDPRNIQAKDFYDNLGRVTKTVEAYDGGSITSNTNKTTEYSYDGMNHVITLQSDLPNSAIELVPLPEIPNKGDILHSLPSTPLAWTTASAVSRRSLTTRELWKLCRISGWGPSSSAPIPSPMLT